MKTNKLPVNASEAIFGFASWLTTRDEPVTFSHVHEAAQAAELADQYCKDHGFPDITENYPDNLRISD